jgi:LmbE family N-acetylglucosaminyl deacetylase
MYNHLFLQFNYLFMRLYSIVICVFFLSVHALAQTPKTYTASEILMQLKKLQVLGSVLYIAAHPDDENTRLLAYLANEKWYRTGYLSLTRGDGGQNLIGDEQGVDLGLIRTQELLAARRIDGAEQFFSTAFDFGFCKNPEEAMKTWGHNKILSDAVWIIRKFRPDIIIARFPEDSRAGHGHHSASGIIAREAFDAAADSTKFPDQLTKGVTVWQAKRLLWNTFNFGGNSTQNENQFKVDVGMYNTYLGKSYGEIAALSRSQHKSQGFGVPAQRGSVVEYFETIKGDKPTQNLMDGVDITWNREGTATWAIHSFIDTIVHNFNAANPSLSVPALVKLYKNIKASSTTENWKNKKLQEIINCIENCSGLFLEATTNNQYAVQGDSIKISFVVNNRLDAAIKNVSVMYKQANYMFNNITKNVTNTYTTSIYIDANETLTQPYWLENTMEKGSFAVTNQQLIGNAESEPLMVKFNVNIEGEIFELYKPLRYKFTDAVKGELYQPVFVVPAIALHITPELNVFNPNGFNNISTKNYRLFVDGKFLPKNLTDLDTLATLTKGTKIFINTTFDVASKKLSNDKNNSVTELPMQNGIGGIFNDIKEIDYDHIPAIKYFKQAKQKILITDVKIIGKKIGYIVGAGDKVPAALLQMGYTVTFLKEADITANNIKQFDAIVTGVRAYNTNDWMGNVYSTLMAYVKSGGVFLVQYNTNNFISNIKSKIGPFAFDISRNRVTDETATVNFLLPNHPALNYPNKITQNDFEGWIQERSIYHAEKIDSNYQRIFSMKDPGEKEDEGSLIIANYGKGKFVYTGVVFFRELPAAVPGAYKLFANLLAPNQQSKKVKIKK